MSNPKEKIYEYKYIAKLNTWFKQYSECKLEEFLYSNSYNDDINEYVGIFSGIYIVGNAYLLDDLKEVGIYEYDNFWLEQGYKIGDEVQMRESTNFDNFIIIK